MISLFISGDGFAFSFSIKKNSDHFFCISVDFVFNFYFSGRVLGLRSTTDPLFQIEKVFDKVKNMDVGKSANLFVRC